MTFTFVQMSRRQLERMMVDYSSESAFQHS